MKDKVIINEYMEELTPKEMLKIIDDKQKDERNLSNPDNFHYCRNVDGYRFSSGDFSQEVNMEINQEQINDIVDNIKMQRVFSTNLVAMGYDENKRVLRVIFKGNSSYLYFNVEPEVYTTLLQSESKGKTLNESVIKQKEKYKYIKLT